MGEGTTNDRAAGLGSFRSYTWWSLTGTTAFFLVFFVGDWALDPAAAAWARGASVVAVTVTVVASVVMLNRRLPRVPHEDGAARPAHLPRGWLATGSVAAAALGAILLTQRNNGLWSVAPAVMVSITATFLPPRRRRLLIAAAAVAAGALGGAVTLLTGGDRLLHSLAFPAGMVVFVGWMTLGMLWAWDIAERLNEGRRMAAELAVKDERLRFAADLHDIQGHHLQVIALKSELAGRLVEADPQRAAAEIKEVQRLASDALTDTRAVVQGYRRTTLEAEIANATRVLAAAGIDARTSVEPEPSAGEQLPAPSRHLLGLVMREATTNVLRHSQARHAQLDYRVSRGQARLEVRNDGAAGEADLGNGSGLRGLTERLEAAGGSLTWEHAGGHFVVTASLPVDAGTAP